MVKPLLSKTRNQVKDIPVHQGRVFSFIFFPLFLASCKDIKIFQRLILTKKLHYLESYLYRHGETLSSSTNYIGEFYILSPVSKYIITLLFYRKMKIFYLTLRNKDCDFHKRKWFWTSLFTWKSHRPAPNVLFLIH